MKYLAFALFAAMPALAQELVFSPAQTEACLRAEGGGADCAYASAEACMIDTPGGSSTVVISGCFDRAYLYWDTRLNAVYGRKMAQAKANDSDAPDFAPSEADALRQMQRSWIAFRDAKCDYARSLWGGGTGGGPAAISCLMHTTAQQVLYLEDIVR